MELVGAARGEEDCHIAIFEVREGVAFGGGLGGGG